MIKKWKDTTKGGLKIVSICGPYTYGWYGVVKNEANELFSINWTNEGKDAEEIELSSGVSDYDLVPVKPVKTYQERNLTLRNGVGLNLQMGKPNIRFHFVDGELVSAEVLKS